MMTKTKLLTMAEAVERLVRDDISIVTCTYFEQKIPFSFAHEVIRQKRRDLTLIGPVSDILFDQLIGAGCVKKVMAAWVGNVQMGIAYNFQHAVELGGIEMVDFSNYTISLALQAGTMGVPFIPTYSTLGSDLLKTNPYLKESSYEGKKMVFIKAINPDLAVIPVQRCDEQGNCHIWGNLGITLEATRAAREVIILTEEIVPPEIIRSDPNRTLIPSFLASAVVCEPFACHPSPNQGYYNRDNQAYRDYQEITRTKEGFEKWLREWIMSVKDRSEYLARLGPKRAESLRIKISSLSAPVEFGF